MRCTELARTALLGAVVLSIATCSSWAQEDAHAILANLPPPVAFAGEDIVILAKETSQWIDSSPPDGGRPEWVQVTHSRLWALTDTGAGILQAVPATLFRTLVHFARVILPTGEVIVLDANEAYDKTDVALDEGAVRLFVFPESAACKGAILDYEIEERADAPPGCLWGRIDVETAAHAGVERHTIEVPAGQELRWEASGKLGLLVRKGGATYQFTVFSATPSGVAESSSCTASTQPGIVFTTASSWAAVADSARATLADPTAEEPVVFKTASDIAGGLGTQEAKMEALLHYVRDHTDYEIVAGSEPYWAAASRDTLALGAGDCKAMAALLTSLLRSMGVQAYPALVATEGLPCGTLDLSVLPAPDSFNHAVVAVPDGASWRILDPTCRRCGEACAYSGNTLWILDGGVGSVGTLFTVPVADRTMDFVMSGSVDASEVRIDVTATVSPCLMRDRYTPYFEDWEAAELARYGRVTKTREEAFAGDIMGERFEEPGVRFGGYDTPTVWTYKVRSHFSCPSYGACYVPLTRFPCRYCYPVTVPASFPGVREGRLTAPMTMTWTITLAMPAGSTVVLPPDVHETAAGIAYDSVSTFAESVLRIAARLDITTSWIAAEEYDEFVRVLRAAEADGRRPIRWSR